MGRPQPVRLTALPRRALLRVHPVEVPDHLIALHLVFPQELPTGPLLIPEQQPLPRDEHQPAVVVQHLCLSAAGVLDLVEDLDGGAAVYRLRRAVIQPPCGVEPDAADLAGEELRCEVDLTDRVVVPEGTQLPRLRQPLLVGVRALVQLLRGSGERPRPRALPCRERQRLLRLRNAGLLLTATTHGACPPFA